ncbi:MAG: glycosyltransferase family A protein [Rhodospirillaceae bacterium]|nr:glycosyltransferase family A protein [Rhodospirillaceae bacterium]
MNELTKVAVSVLTATYNRAPVLHRVYDSLNRQKTRDFEWVVIDDGSTDETPELLGRWQSEADFPVTWFRYENNRGQIPAVNEGRKLVSGTFTLKLDSDDALTENAMETIAAWRTKTDIDELPDVCGMAFRCVDELGNTVGKLKGGKVNFPREFMLLSFRDARYRKGIDFDIAVVYKTEFYAKMGYGELDNSENLPPSIGVRRISDRQKIFFIDCPIRTYYRHDGTVRLSDDTSRRVKWPRGRYMKALSILNEDMDYCWESPKVFFNAARKVTRLGLHLGRSPWRQFRDLTNGRARLLWLAGMPGGCFGYLRDRLRGRTAPVADPDIAAWGPAAPPKNPVLHPPPG